MSKSSPALDVFPTLHTCVKLGNGDDLYDIKFFPYATQDDEQVFAVTGGKDIIVCRINEDADPPFDVIRWFRDQNDNSSYNSLVWTRHPVTNKPVICTAGSKPKQIQMLDVETGAHVRSLVGHGQGINELAISPLSTNILASASEDYTIRLWDLRPKYEHQPCVAMFAGGGHKMPILAMAFHPNGRWLLSAGMDTAVCLWAVPPLDQLERGEVQESNSKTHVDPMMIHYPHFRSTEVHHNYVDCMVFYGDLIISRNANSDPNTAKENEILLWKIDGFDSELEPPAEYPTPVPGVDTRSAFPHASDRRGFQRLLTFDMPYTDRFYLRFSLLHAPGFRPILAMGSVKYRYSLWDLQALEEGYEENGDVLKNAGRKRKGKQKGAINSENLSRLEELRKGDTSSGVGSARQQPSTDGRESSVATGHGSGTPDPSTTSISAPTGRKYDVDDSFQPIAAHRFITAKNNLYKQYFATPQMDWSPDGSWLIGVADKGMMVMMKRDKAAGRSEP